MKFWDSSALVPLVVTEKESDYCLQVLSDDRAILTWCLSRVEVMSALCRRMRDGALVHDDFQKAKTRLDLLAAHVYEIGAVGRVKRRALRLLEVHPLRAADACQLAAALIATQEDPERLELICFDERLNDAARKEGFTINPQR